MTEPIPVRVTRYRCPYCPRGHSTRRRAVEHIARCWRNPDVKSCKTCKHFERNYDGYGDDCNLGIDLSGRPACTRCCGSGRLFEIGGVVDCPECSGDGAEIRPGPTVDCDKWEGLTDG